MSPSTDLPEHFYYCSSWPLWLHLDHLEFWSPCHPSLCKLHVLNHANSPWISDFWNLHVSLPVSFPQLLPFQTIHSNTPLTIPPSGCFLTPPPPLPLYPCPCHLKPQSTISCKLSKSKLCYISCWVKYGIRGQKTSKFSVEPNSVWLSLSSPSASIISLRKAQGIPKKKNSRNLALVTRYPLAELDR